MANEETRDLDHKTFTAAKFAFKIERTEHERSAAILAAPAGVG